MLSSFGNVTSSCYRMRTYFFYLPFLYENGCMNRAIRRKKTVRVMMTPFGIGRLPNDVNEVVKLADGRLLVQSQAM